VHHFLVDRLEKVPRLTPGVITPSREGGDSPVAKR
jgi:hypothetical protein